MGDPFDEMHRMRRAMRGMRYEHPLEHFDHKLLPERKGIELFRQPLSDIKETDKEIIASIEIPGVDKKDIQLNITETNLEVKVEKKEEVRVEKKGYVKAERSYKGFYRSFLLPARVILEKSKANYKDGVLEVVMPKAEKKKVAVKKVEVK
ncbi:MAG TPA: Hsp20/alpha crystallin family protein [Candidatus Nanoarchaeia archaeon]|nr:Hsp20/alpha crystallin family protein [Candidatus Nanoarchaeia archaeon]